MRTAITQADTSFALLVCQPAPLAFDARGIDGLPDRLLPLDELRDLLVAGLATGSVGPGAGRGRAGEGQRLGPSRARPAASAR